MFTPPPQLILYCPYQRMLGFQVMSSWPPSTFMEIRSYTKPGIRIPELSLAQGSGSSRIKHIVRIQKFLGPKDPDPRTFLDPRIRIPRLSWT